MEFDQYSVTTKLTNQSECDGCLHQEVCTLTKDYQDTVMKLRSLELEQYIQVTTKCEHYHYKMTPQPRVPL
jgi:hypothetical protein